MTAASSPVREGASEGGVLQSRCGPVMRRGIDRPGAGAVDVRAETYGGPWRKRPGAAVIPAAAQGRDAPRPAGRGRGRGSRRCAGGGVAGPGHPPVRPLRRHVASGAWPGAPDQRPGRRGRGLRRPQPGPRLGPAGGPAGRGTAGGRARIPLRRPGRRAALGRAGRPWWTPRRPRDGGGRRSAAGTRVAVLSPGLRPPISGRLVPHRTGVPRGGAVPVRSSAGRDGISARRPAERPRAPRRAAVAGPARSRAAPSAAAARRRHRPAA